MRVWITGGDGILGQALQQILALKGIDYAASSRKDADITEQASLERFVRRRGPFSHIIHTAAYTAVDQAEKEPGLAWRVNAKSPELLGKIARKENSRVLLLSTDYVFSGTKEAPYLETDEVSPATVYGKTKAEGEARLQEVLPEACIVRTSWLFGSKGKHFVATMINLMKKQLAIRVVSDQRGRPTYAPDLAGALFDLLPLTGLFHLANAGETTWYSFAHAVKEQALAKGMKLSCTAIEPVMSQEYPSLAPRPLYSVLNTSKADQARGSPMRSWREGLEEYFRSYA